MPVDLDALQALAARGAHAGHALVGDPPALGVGVVVGLVVLLAGEAARELAAGHAVGGAVGERDAGRAGLDEQQRRRHEVEDRRQPAELLGFPALDRVAWLRGAHHASLLTGVWISGWAPDYRRPLNVMTCWIPLGRFV